MRAQRDPDALEVSSCRPLFVYHVAASEPLAEDIFDSQSHALHAFAGAHHQDFAHGIEVIDLLAGNRSAARLKSWIADDQSILFNPYELRHVIVRIGGAQPRLDDRQYILPPLDIAVRGKRPQIGDAHQPR